jgi:RNA polymerase sigma-70 factor (ECF subfamily)
MARLDPQALVRHVDRLHRAAWGLTGKREDADDLVQEMCARVLAKPRELDGADELAYLMRALRNTYLSGRRTASRRPRTDVTLDDVVVADPRSGTRPERVAEHHDVFLAIAALPEDFRLALVAVDVVGLSYAEAGQILDAREATIATRLFRARAQVARTLQPPPAEPSAEVSATTRSPG